MSTINGFLFEIRRTHKEKAPAGYMGTNEVAAAIGMEPKTLRKNITNALRADFKSFFGCKFDEINESAIDAVHYLRSIGKGKAQNGLLFPRGLTRKGGRWIFPKEEVKRFLQFRLIMAQAELKTANRNLSHFNDRFSNEIYSEE